MDSYKLNNIKSTSMNNSSSSKLPKIIYIILIIIIIFLVIYVLMCYYNYSSINCYEKKSFLSYLFDFNSNDVCSVYQKPMPKTPPMPIIKKDSTPKLGNLLQKKEVYHISNQEYTYDQSKCKCSSYGGRLATKDEVTNAYNAGANWCSYGWSEGQNAFYPVQKCFYDALSEDDDFLENSDKYCGKPGLNGGYFSDSELKFGVNCYGVKPKGSIVKPKKAECTDGGKDFCELPKNSSSNQKLSSDVIVPFNENKWSY